MGYTTDLEGTFSLDHPLSREQTGYLRRFSDTRRMKRDAKIADPIRVSADLIL